MRKKNAFISTIFCLLLLFTFNPCAQITDEKAASLANQFLPPAIFNYIQFSKGNSWLESAIANPLLEIQLKQALQYLAFKIPNDSSQYVLLGWSNYDQVYWRLLKSPDNGVTFTMVQDSEIWYDAFPYGFSLRAQDLTNDGIPEILIEHAQERLTVLTWRNEKLVCITPGTEKIINDKYGFFATDLWTSDGISLIDYDGDNVAEILVPTYFALKWPIGPDGKEDSSSGKIGVPETPNRLYKFNGNNYFLWKEFPWSNDDPFPLIVPSIGIFHPGTIPLSELSSPGNGELRLFVSHPGARNTVEDIETSSLKFKDIAASFKKQWKNNKQPDTTSANWEWMACPVRCTELKNQGEWNPSPEDPYFPSPDERTELHFVGPYLEFRIPKSAVFPYLYKTASTAFNKEPDRTEYFISVPISGKMKNGKLLSVSALVCIKKTGNSGEAAKTEKVEQIKATQDKEKKK